MKIEQMLRQADPLKTKIFRYKGYILLGNEDLDF